MRRLHFRVCAIEVLEGASCPRILSDEQVLVTGGFIFIISVHPLQVLMGITSDWKYSGYMCAEDTKH